WATVGSSNLDPLSLSLNLEANVIIQDRDFNRLLRSRLQALMQKHCWPVRVSSTAAMRFWRLGAGFLVFHFLRRFPAWAGWLPAHRPGLRPLETPIDAPRPATTDEREQGAT